VSTPPGVIPYVEHHVGPRRVLTVELRGSQIVPPVVGIDGRPYQVVWGSVAFEVPADRACHVSVHYHLDRMYGGVSTLLAPEAKPHLTYTTGGLRAASLT
jgi:hypothetical protein